MLFCVLNVDVYSFLTVLSFLTYDGNSSFDNPILQFFLLYIMTSLQRRQPNPKLLIIRPFKPSEDVKFDQSNAFVSLRPNIIINATSNGRPPTPNANSDHPPQNYFMRKAKIATNRAIKSKTDHSKNITVPDDRPSSQNHHYRQLAPIRSQSAHRSNSAKSFLIRKKPASSLGRRTQLEPPNGEIEIHNLQKNLMVQINKNSVQLEKKFKNDECQERNKTVQQGKTDELKEIQNQRRSDYLQDTLVPHADRNNIIELLQTKKSCTFSKVHKIHNNSTSKTRNAYLPSQFDEQKQNFKLFRQNCCKYEFQPSKIPNRYLRKDDKHKSNQQFDRKEKVLSACRTIRVPWTQSQNEQHCQRLKKSGGQSKKQQTQVAQHPSYMFGGISMIGSRMNSSINCGIATQSLKDLCKQLELKRIVNQQA